MTEFTAEAFPDNKVYGQGRPVYGATQLGPDPSSHVKPWAAAAIHIAELEQALMGLEGKEVSREKRLAELEGKSDRQDVRMRGHLAELKKKSDCQDVRMDEWADVANAYVEYLQNVVKVQLERVSALEDCAIEELETAKKVYTNEGHLLELAKTVRDLTVEVIKLRGDHDTTQHVLRTLLQALPDPSTPNSVYTFADTPSPSGPLEHKGEDFADSVVEDIDAEDGDPFKASARAFLQTGLDLAILPPEDTLFVRLIAPPNASNPQDCSDFDSYLIKLATEALSLDIFDFSYVNLVGRMVFGAESTDSVTRVAPVATLEATKECIGVWQKEGRSLVVSFAHPRSEHRLILVALIASMLDAVSSQQVSGHIHTLVKASQQNT